MTPWTTRIRLTRFTATLSARTWNWLWEFAEEENPPDALEARGDGKRPRSKARAAAETRSIDFGIDAFNELLREHTDDGRIPDKLLAPSASLPAPVMLPAYVDFWCQTSPIPAPIRTSRCSFTGNSVASPTFRFAGARLARRQSHESRPLVRRRGAAPAHGCGVHERAHLAGTPLARSGRRRIARFGRSAGGRGASRGWLRRRRPGSTRTRDDKRRGPLARGCE